MEEVGEVVFLMEAEELSLKEQGEEVVEEDVAYSEKKKQKESVNMEVEEAVEVAYLPVVDEFVGGLNQTLNSV